MDKKLRQEIMELPPALRRLAFDFNMPDQRVRISLPPDYLATRISSVDTAKFYGVEETSPGWSTMMKSRRFNGTQGPLDRYTSDLPAWW